MGIALEYTSSSIGAVPVASIPRLIRHCLPAGGNLLVAELAQCSDKVFPGNGMGAQAFQVIGRHLTINQLAAALLKVTNQRDEAGFRSVVAAAEHGLTEKNLAQCNAME